MRELEQFYSLLNNIEDYLSVGFRQNYALPAHLSMDKILLDVPHEVNLTKSNLDSEHGQLTNLGELCSRVESCFDCFLENNSASSVVGEGLGEAGLLIASSYPLREDVNFRKPYASSVGEFFNKWLEAINLNRYKDCYTTYLIKCRASDERQTLALKNKCLAYFKQEVAFLKPKIILCLGSNVANLILGTNHTTNQLRDNIYSYQDIPLFITYEPAFVLQEPASVPREESYKQKVWEDLKKLKHHLSNATK